MKDRLISGFTKATDLLFHAGHMLLLSVGTIAVFQYLDEEFPRGYATTRLAFGGVLMVWFVWTFLVVPFQQGIKESQCEPISNAGRQGS